MSRTVIITGGAGFIGSNFIRSWLKEDLGPLVNIDKLTYAGNLDSLTDLENNPRYLFVKGDIGDSQLLSRLLDQHQPRAILNFAAESHVDRSIDYPEEFILTNVLGTFRLLEATKDYYVNLSVQEQKQFRFLHVSTDEVYGSLGVDGKFTEQTPYAPNSPYSASKAASDHFARAYYQTFGLPVLITNCSNNYGPNQFPEKLIPLVILNAIEGKPLPVYGDGQHIRDWLYVADHCRALRVVLSGGTPGDVYNIGGDCERTNLDVIKTVCDIVDRQHLDLPHRPCSSLIQFVADRPGHDRRYSIDASKIHHELGWKPLENLESGLEQTVQWYLDNPSWTERVTKKRYNRQRLGMGLK